MKLKKHLKSIEWIRSSYGVFFCPACGGGRDEHRGNFDHITRQWIVGHLKGCWLDKEVNYD